MKPKQYAGVSNEVKYKSNYLYNVEHVVNRIIKFSKNVNNFLSTNPWSRRVPAG